MVILMKSIDSTKKKNAQMVLAILFLWVTRGSPMLCTKYIAFACYPPRSDTTHDSGHVFL
jgi:hypothetical protein